MEFLAGRGGVNWEAPLVTRGRGVGIVAKRIVVHAFGETWLLLPGQSYVEEKAKNHRMEVWFYIPPSLALGENLRLEAPMALGR